MTNVTKKDVYHSPVCTIRGIDSHDVIRTSNGVEVDYQQQGWENVGGFDTPFEE